MTIEKYLPPKEYEQAVIDICSADRVRAGTARQRITGHDLAQRKFLQKIRMRLETLKIEILDFENPQSVIEEVNAMIAMIKDKC